jgi:hypothetical protein
MTQGPWKYYHPFDEECAEAMLDTLIADFKDAERVGTGKPLSEWTAEELQYRLSEFEITLNWDDVEFLKDQGGRTEAAALTREILQIQAMRMVYK